MLAELAFPASLIRLELTQNAKNVFSPVSSIPAGVDAIDTHYPLVAPSSRCIDMNVEEASYITYCEHDIGWCNRNLLLFWFGLRLDNLPHPLTSYT